MEQTAHTAKERVAQKKDQLQGLADELQQMEADCVDRQQIAAADTRETLMATINTLPAPNVPAITPDPVPDDVSVDERGGLDI